MSYSSPNESTAHSAMSAVGLLSVWEHAISGPNDLMWLHYPGVTVGLLWGMHEFLLYHQISILAVSVSPWDNNTFWLYHPGIKIHFGCITLG